MNALRPVAIDGEVIPPAATVSVYGTTHPLNAVAGARIHCRVPAGWSIAEILGEALSHKPGWRLRRDLIVRINDHVIPEENWSRVRVKQGATVTFIPRLQDGGNIWRSVLGLVVTVAALVIAPYAAPALVTALGATGITVGASTAAALAAGGIMLAGTLALNALFPVRPPAEQQTVNSRSLNSIQGAQNQQNPFGTVPVVLGRHRLSPFFAAKPYTEIVGEDQWLRLLVCWGYGPLYIDVSSLKIGETPLSSFSDYQVEHRQGFPGDAPITLYPMQVDEVPLNITLTGGVDSIIQTTPPETGEVSVDWTATEGIYIINEKTGDAEGYDVQCNAYYRPVGGSSWTIFAAVHFTRSTSPTRRGARVVLPSPGQYEVMVQKVNAEKNDDKIKEKIVWTALRSVKIEQPIKFPKWLALTALRIRATDQLSGVIDTFNGEVMSIVANSSNGSTWVPNVTTNNPADLFRHVLQGPANARPRPDSAIDLASLIEWSNYCQINGFKFNQVVTGAGSVYDKLCDIAAAGRAVPTFLDGKWGVVWDRPSDPIVQHFTPRNSWGFQGQKPYVQQPHGWRVSFINAANGYTQDERIVYDDGYSAANATLFEGIEFPGVTDPAQIWKLGRFHIAQSRLRPEKITLNVGWEHLVCTRGDRVRVTHDVMLVGIASGRVKSVEGQVVTFDEQVTIEEGKTYGIQFRVPEDARTIDRAVDEETAAGDYLQLTLVGDLTGVTQGTLFSFGETDRESAVYRVQGISHQKDLIATLTLVDDAPEISSADSGAIPDYNPNVTIPVDPFSLPPRGLTWLEVIDGYGASVRALVRLSWQVPRFGRIASFEVQSIDNDGGGVWTTVASVLPPHTSVDVPLTSAGSWTYRVRCIFADGTVSNWVTTSQLSLLGLTFPPGDITNLHQRSVDGQTVLGWDTVQDQRTVYYEVRKGTSWDTGLVVGDVVTQPPWPTTGDGTYHIRAYVLSPFASRIYSVTTSSITIAGSIISRNIIVSRDELTEGWPGSLDGGVISGSFIRTDVDASITEAFAQEIIDQLALEGLHIAVYVSPTIVDIGRPAECRFWTEFEASGVLQGDDFLAQIDVLGSGDILGTSPTRFIQAFPIWRFAVEGETDVFAAPDIFDPADIFAGDITWLDWVAISSGTRVARYFVPGFVLITNDATTDATGTKFRWFVDVPDRNDDYTELDVPDTGLDVVFYSGGFDGIPAGGLAPTPFNGGPNGANVPHVQRAIINGTNGDEVKVTNLTLAGCTVHVVNAGSNVARAGVNLLVRGY